MPTIADQGSAIRVRHLLLGLARRHRVTLVAYRDPRAREADDPLRRAGVQVHEVAAPRAGLLRTEKLKSLASGRSFQGMRRDDPVFRRVVNRVASGGAFDLVQIEGSEMYVARPDTPTPVVLDEHNIEYEVRERILARQRRPWKRLFNTFDTAKFRREERLMWTDVDGCLVTSGREAEIVQLASRGKPVAVIPNGVDVDHFAPTDAVPDADTIVFVGLMDYRPNIDGVTFFVRDVLPLIRRRRPRAHLTVVGKNVQPSLRRLEGDGVRFTDWVPDVRPYIASAACLVVPLPAGGGTRLKVLEGLASGQAMVSTTIGCEGIDVTPGHNILVADDAHAFADAVLSVMGDRELARALGAAGRRLAEEVYDWRVIVPGLEAFHAQIAAGGA